MTDLHLIDPHLPSTDRAHADPADSDPAGASLRWEACVAFRSEATDEPTCLACGWPADEHLVLLAS